MRELRLQAVREGYCCALGTFPERFGQLPQFTLADITTNGSQHTFSKQAGLCVPISRSVTLVHGRLFIVNVSYSSVPWDLTFVISLYILYYGVPLNSILIVTFDLRITSVFTLPRRVRQIYRQEEFRNEFNQLLHIIKELHKRAACYVNVQRQCQTPTGAYSPLIYVV